MTPVIDQHHLIRERRFEIDRAWLERSIERVIHALQSEHATGKLVINLSQGAATSIQFEERCTLQSPSDTISLDTHLPSMV